MSSSAIRMHHAVTALLTFGILVFVGLALAGRVHLGPAHPQPAPDTPEVSPESPPSKAGRYQIEKVDDIRRLIESAGKLRFLGEHLLEAWVFKYRGGYLQCRLATEVNGKPVTGEPLPNNWASLLGQDEGVRENKAAAFGKQGFIVLAAMPATISLSDAEEKYRPHLFGVLAGAPHGALHLLAPLHFDVMHIRPYRLFLSAGPLPNELGAGFNVWSENGMLVRESIVPRALSEEPFYTGGNLNLEPGKDILLLERQRGASRIRLEARFLGDGEVRDLASKN